MSPEQKRQEIMQREKEQSCDKIKRLTKFVFNKAKNEIENTNGYNCCVTFWEKDFKNTSYNEQYKAIQTVINTLTKIGYEAKYYRYPMWINDPNKHSYIYVSWYEK